MSTATMMPRETDAAPRLTDHERAEIVALSEGADCIALKLTAIAQDPRSALTALGIDPIDAEIHVVYFFDTPDLVLTRGGIAARARRAQRRGEDSVVTLRPVQPASLTPALRRSENFAVEIDAMPGTYVCSGSLRRAIVKPVVREALRGEQPIRKIFSKEQRAFFRDQAPAGIELDALTPLGPIFALKLRVVLPEFPRKLAAEMWMYPDGSRLLEVSTKSSPREALTVAEEARSVLAHRGVRLTGDQVTRTTRALEFFATTAASV